MVDGGNIARMSDSSIDFTNFDDLFQPVYSIYTDGSKIKVRIGCHPKYDGYELDDPRHDPAEGYGHCPANIFFAITNGLWITINNVNMTGKKLPLLNPFYPYNPEHPETRPWKIMPTITNHYDNHETTKLYDDDGHTKRRSDGTYYRYIGEALGSAADRTNFLEKAIKAVIANFVMPLSLPDDRRVTVIPDFNIAEQTFDLKDMLIPGNDYIIKI